MLLGLLIWLTLRWLFCFHYYTLERCSFRQAVRRSYALHRGRLLKDGLVLLVLQILFLLSFLLLSGLVVGLIFLCTKLFGDLSVLYSITLGIAIFCAGLLLALYSCLSLPIHFVCISVIFYRHKERCREPVASFPVEQSIPRPRRGVRIAGTCLALVCIAMISVFSYLMLTDRLDFNIEYVSAPEVTAHRGASAAYPENTMLAFQMAKEMNADWIELDVQLTQDGVPVILHDSNLRRTTGVNRNIWEVTYEEIQELDAGSWLSPEFSDQRIPTLDQVLEFAGQEDIRLNIELKPKRILNRLSWRLF